MCFYASCFNFMKPLEFFGISDIRNRIEIMDLITDLYFSTNIADIGIARFFIRQVRIKQLLIFRIIIVKKKLAVLFLDSLCI